MSSKATKPPLGLLKATSNTTWRQTAKLNFHPNVTQIIEKVAKENANQCSQFPSTTVMRIFWRGRYKNTQSKLSWGQSPFEQCGVKGLPHFIVARPGLEPLSFWVPAMYLCHKAAICQLTSVKRVLLVSFFRHFDRFTYAQMKNSHKKTLDGNPSTDIFHV